MYIVVLKLDPHQNEVIDNFTSKLLVKLCPILYNHVVVIMKNLGIWRMEYSSKNFDYSR